MKITTIALVVAIPFLSCGTIISPDPKTEKLTPPAITSNKTISATNPVITIDSSPSKNTSKNIDTTKNYLEISDTESYKKFHTKFSSIKPSFDDLKTAQSIIDLRKRDTMGEIKSFLPKVLSLVNNNSHFNFYTSWLNELNILANKKLIFERMEYCQERWEKNKVTIFENHLENLCHQSMKDYIIAKGGNFPDTWDVSKIWTYIKRKANFYFSSPENSSLIKKAISNLKKEQQTALLSHVAEILLAQDIAIHSSLTPLLSSAAPLGASAIFDMNARRQQRRDMSNELSAIYGTGGSEVEPNYYDNVTQDLIQTTLTSKLTLGEDYILPRLIVFADFLTRNSRQDLSRKVLDFVKDNFKISAADEVEYHFNYLWSYITLQDYKAAIKYAEKNSLINSFNDLDSKLQYWITYSYQMQNDLIKSLKYYSTLVNTNPMTYYSIMAMKNIKIQDEKFYEKLVKANFGSRKELIEPSKEWEKIFKANFIRLTSWAKLGSYSMLSHEYAFLQEAIEKQLSTVNEQEKLVARTQILHGTAILFNSASSYLSTFRFMGQAIQQKKVIVDFNFIQTLYPTPFDNLIKSNAYDVDHILLFGLMRQESGFDPRAKSAVGATGLMQLMPYTARMVDRSIASNLTNPNNNTSIGIRYLKRLLDKYNNNLVYALSAYNAGDHRVNSWMKSYFKHDSLLFNIESIPYTETRNYVKLIFRNMFFYKLVEEHDIKDSYSFNQLFNIQLGFNQ